MLTLHVRNANLNLHLPRLHPGRENSHPNTGGAKLFTGIKTCVSCVLNMLNQQVFLVILNKYTQRKLYKKKVDNHTGAI